MDESVVITVYPNYSISLQNNTILTLFQAYINYLSIETNKSVNIKENKKVIKEEDLEEEWRCGQ